MKSLIKLLIVSALLSLLFSPFVHADKLPDHIRRSIFQRIEAFRNTKIDGVKLNNSTALEDEKIAAMLNNFEKPVLYLPPEVGLTSYRRPIKCGSRADVSEKQVWLQMQTHAEIGRASEFFTKSKVADDKVVESLLQDALKIARSPKQLLSDLPYGLSYLYGAMEMYEAQIGPDGQFSTLNEITYEKKLSKYKIGEHYYHKSCLNLPFFEYRCFSLHSSIQKVDDNHYILLNAPVNSSEIKAPLSFIDIDRQKHDLANNQLKNRLAQGLGVVLIQKSARGIRVATINDYSTGDDLIIKDLTKYKMNLGFGSCQSLSFMFDKLKIDTKYYQKEVNDRFDCFMTAHDQKLEKMAQGMLTYLAKLKLGSVRGEIKTNYRLKYRFQSEGPSYLKPILDESVQKAFEIQKFDRQLAGLIAEREKLFNTILYSRDKSALNALTRFQEKDLKRVQSQGIVFDDGGKRSYADEFNASIQVEQKNVAELAKIAGQLRKLVALD